MSGWPWRRQKSHLLNSLRDALCAQVHGVGTGQAASEQPPETEGRVHRLATRCGLRVILPHLVRASNPGLKHSSILTRKKLTSRLGSRRRGTSPSEVSGSPRAWMMREGGPGGTQRWGVSEGGGARGDGPQT